MKNIKKINKCITYIYKYKKKIINSLKLRQLFNDHNFEIFFNNMDILFNQIQNYLKIYNIKLKLQNNIKKNKNNTLLIKKIILQLKPYNIKLKKNKILIFNIYKENLLFIKLLPNILDDNITDIDKIIYETKIKKLDNILLGYKDICRKSSIIDFIKASQISGPRSVCYKNKGYFLFKALENFFFQNAINKGYQPLLLPLYVKHNSAFNSGLLPKFYNEIYDLNNNNFLIPTAEVSLINFHQQEVLKNLPKKYFSFTPCFRKESGSYGKNAGGLIRLHQFYKNELVIFCHKDKSEFYHKQLLEDALCLVKLLGFSYRILLNSAQNTSFQSYKTYDIEVWLYYQKKFIEICSCSNTINFQSRRTNTLDKKGNFVHILNCSALPVERIIAVILEQYQTNNSFKIPKVLQPFMKLEEIKYFKK